MSDTLVVHVTCASLAEATGIARALVELRLAACATVGSPLASIYRWEGRMEEATEYPLAVKTRLELFEAVSAEVRRRHSYDVPEIVALPVRLGYPPYLAWVDENTLDENTALAEQTPHPVPCFSKERMK